MNKHFAVNQVWLFDYKSGLRPAVILDITENSVKLCPMSFFSIMFRNYQWVEMELIERDARSFLGYRMFWFFWRRESGEPVSSSYTTTKENLSNISQNGLNNQVGAVINNTFER